MSAGLEFQELVHLCLKHANLVSEVLSLESVMCNFLTHKGGFPDHQVQVA